jgi:hypothetical protein
MEKMISVETISGGGMKEKSKFKYEVFDIF